MVSTVQSLHTEPGHGVEIVVHVDETLGEKRRNDLAAALQGSNGINAAEFCPLRYHLMLVHCNKELMNSQDVLGRIKSENVHAELIGPV